MFVILAILLSAWLTPSWPASATLTRRHPVRKIIHISAAGHFPNFLDDVEAVDVDAEV